MNLPKIGITLGDPCGIGPEIILKACSSENSLPKAHYILFGSSRIIEEEKRALGIELDIPSSHKYKSDFPSLSLLEIENPLKTIKKALLPKNQDWRLFFSSRKPLKKQKRAKFTLLLQLRYPNVPGI